MSVKKKISSARMVFSQSLSIPNAEPRVYLVHSQSCTKADFVLLNGQLCEHSLHAEVVFQIYREWPEA